VGTKSGTYILESEAEERIKVLEKQLSPLSSATPSHVAGLEAERDLQHGRAEAYHNEAVKYRDQVKNLSHLLEKMAERNQNLEQLRARHAALVEVIVRLENEWDADWPMPYCLVEFLESSEIAKLKAALAEVKG
jgi:uncharacterized coiled-coil DUF342 family protein